jgi:hypothetical protein
MLSDSDVARFKRDGFLLIKGLFSADEVARFRELGAQVTEPVDLASLPGLENLWTDERLVTIAKRLLGEPITYFGEASYRRHLFPSETPLLGKLHHDAKGTRAHLFHRQNLPTPEPYPILRFAMYLQDHSCHSGGLKLVPGSHQMDTSTFNEAELVHLDVPSESGDAVAFCNKILHSPFALRRKNAPHTALSVPDEVELFARDPDAFLPSPAERCAMFVDYAGPSVDADIYIKSRAVNPTNTRDGFLDLALRGSLIDDAARLGVRLRLDSAIVEAVQKIVETADGPTLNKTGRQLLKVLPMLCRQSRPWSDHFNFVPEPPSSDSEMAALPILNAVSQKVAQLRSVVKWRADLVK